MWVAWVIKVLTPSKVKFNYDTSWQTSIPEPISFGFSCTDILMHAVSMIMNHKSEPFTILFHANITLTSDRRMQHLNGKVSLEPERDKLFEFIGNLTNRVGRCIS
jgi:hypothetical protein